MTLKQLGRARTLAGVATFAATALGAQTADRTSFYLLSGKDTVMAERYTRTATALTGEFGDRIRGGRMAYSATVTPNGLVTNVTTQFFRSATDTIGQRATFTVRADTMIAQMGNAAPANVPSVAGVIPLVNPSVAFIEQVLMRARAIGGEGAAIPVFIIGTPQPMSATVTWVGADSATIEYAGVTMRFAVSPRGQILGGTVPAQNVVFVRAPVTDVAPAPTRDYSAPRGAPYTAEDVVVRTRTGLKLAGTLTIPRGRVSGRAPVVVTISGTGPEDRDGESMSLRGYRPFRELADSLGKRGIAVLRLDDRGVGGSDAGPTTATADDVADDFRAAIAFLRTRPEIDATRIALVGHSEGAAIATMVAQADGQLRGVVLMAGAASSGRAILLSQQHYIVDTVMKLTGKSRTDALATYQRNTDSVAKVLPWMKHFLAFEPVTIARKVETPALILHGETDHQVPVPEAERLAMAFRTAGNRRVVVQHFPETNHLFVADASGSFDYTKLPSLRVRPAVLGTIADWLSERFQ